MFRGWWTSAGRRGGSCGTSLGEGATDRPRRLDDDELLTRIAVFLEHRGELTPWTLADVAPAAGISPAGLIRRFGSKRGLLHALTRRWVESIPCHPLAQDEDPEVVLAEYAAREFGAATVDGAAFAMSEVIAEVRDPELASLLAEGWRLQARTIAQLLEAMNLPGLADPEVGGLLLLDALHGSLYRSAVGLDQTSPLLTLERFLEMWR